MTSFEVSKNFIHKLPMEFHRKNSKSFFFLTNYELKTTSVKMACLWGIQNQICTRSVYCVLLQTADLIRNKTGIQLATDKPQKFSLQ